MASWADAKLWAASLPRNTLHSPGDMEYLGSGASWSILLLVLGVKAQVYLDMGERSGVHVMSTFLVGPDPA